MFLKSFSSRILLCLALAPWVSRIIVDVQFSIYTEYKWSPSEIIYLKSYMCSETHWLHVSVYETLDAKLHPCTVTSFVIQLEASYQVMDSSNRSAHF